MATTKSPSTASALAGQPSEERHVPSVKWFGRPGVPRWRRRRWQVGSFLVVAICLLLGGWGLVLAEGVPVAEAEVVRGDPSRPWVSLVVNAGAGYTPAEAILDTLREKEVRTTFFLLGWWAERQPALVKRIADEGHEVANHGHAVFDLTQVSDAEVIADLETADQVISAITGKTTKPLWSPSAGYRNARVRRLAASIGYRCIFWTLDSGDWRVDAVAADVKRRVLNNAENGSIIVMHFDSARSADSVAAIWPDLIDGLRAQGYRLVTITELVTGKLASDP